MSEAGNDSKLSYSGGILEGYIIRYNSLSAPIVLPNGRKVFERFLPGAFSASVAAIRTKAYAIKVNVEHERDNALMQIGSSETNVEIEDRAEGVYARIRMLNTSISEDIYKLNVARIVTGASIEFAPYPGEEPRYEVQNGDYVRTFARAKLDGFAVVLKPMYPDAQVFARSVGEAEVSRIAAEVAAFEGLKLSSGQAAEAQGAATVAPPTTAVRSAGLGAFQSNKQVGEPMDKNELKKEQDAIYASAATENRSLSADEQARAEKLKAEIAKLETVEQPINVEARSVAASKLVKGEVRDVNVILRSITKGSNDVGDKLFVDDIVRQYQEQSEILAAHGNIQRRSNGNTFQFMKVVPGGSAASRTEGQAGSADNSSVIEPGEVVFTTYSGGIVTVTQESHDDFAYDVSQEVYQFGLAKSVQAFDADAIAKLETAFSGTYTDTATTSWQVSDLLNAVYGLANRHRNASYKFIANGVTMPKLVSLLDAEDAYKLEWIGFRKENTIVDPNMANDELIICDVTKALAIGFKEPVRVVKLETSGGYTIEVRPRMAVELRDSTAVANRKLKTA